MKWRSASFSSTAQTNSYYIVLSSNSEENILHYVFCHFLKYRLLFRMFNGLTSPRLLVLLFLSFGLLFALTGAPFIFWENEDFHKFNFSSLFRTLINCSISCLGLRSAVSRKHQRTHSSYFSVSLVDVGWIWKVILKIIKIGLKMR